MSNLRHVGIVCNNLEKMTKFYKLLGFTEVINIEVYGKFIDELIALNNVNIDIVKFKSKNNDCLIELLKYKKLKNSKQKNEVYEQGISHISITVEDIDRTFEILKLNGAEFLTSPLLSEDGKVKVCFCKDIEGNWIEVCQDL